MQQIFIIETSNIANYNLIPFFQKWKIIISVETKNKLDSMSLNKLQNGALTTKGIPIWEYNLNVLTQYK
jgi:hypothetical protein